MTISDEADDFADDIFQVIWNQFAVFFCVQFISVGGRLMFYSQIDQQDGPDYIEILYFAILLFYFLYVKRGGGIGITV
jgi:hypothetical protein